MSHRLSSHFPHVSLRAAPRLQHPPKLPMAPPPHIEVLLSIYRIFSSSSSSAVSSSGPFSVFKVVDPLIEKSKFHRQNPEAAWREGVSVSKRLLLELGIFCGVWQAKIYLEVRSPQITKTPAEKGDAGERALGNPSQAVY